MMPKKLEMLYEGKAKILFNTEESNILIQYFKDDATAFNKQKFDVIDGKGVLNNEISSIIMEKLKGVLPTHFIKKINEREQLVKKVTIIPLEVVVRNIVAGSFAKNYGVEAGKVFKTPCVEFFYKKDELNDPLISPNQIIALEILDAKQISIVENYALKVNSVLKPLFQTCDFTLVDFKIEFGFDENGEIMLADEISPDSSRLWNKEGKSFDKDIFRKNLGSLTEGYKIVLEK